jgi:hypothetical protein
MSASVPLPWGQAATHVLVALTCQLVSVTGEIEKGEVN